MSANHDPPRLGAEPGTSDWLRTALSDARTQAPSGDAIDRLTSRVEAAIMAGLPGPEIGAPAKAHVGSLATGKFVVVGIGVAIGVFAGTAWNIKHTPRKMSEPAAIVGSAAPVTSASSASEAPLVPDQPATNPASASTANDRDARSSGLPEAALLDAARAAVRTDARRALSLTQEFGRRFPHSPLMQEREVIAIEALVRLGHTTAAKARAERFSRMFPGSAHQQKLDQLTRASQ